ncbi:MAG: hypothetical protein WC222_03880 [Parachlamydiales bacterium]|jgi:hypothetical protein
MLIPPGCNNTAIIDRIEHAQTTEEVISELCLGQNFSDPKVRSSSHEVFLQYYEAAANDPQWLSEHPELGNKLVEKAFEIIYSPDNKEFKYKYLQVVREHLPVFREAIPSLGENNVEINTRTKKVYANSLMLSSQSTYYKGLLSENGNHAYKTESKGENPKIINAVIHTLQTLQAKPKNYSVEEYGQILGYAHSIQADASTFPAFEANMLNDLKPENAYEMAVLARKHGLESLLEKSLKLVAPTINEGNWKTVLDKAVKDEQQEVKNLCVNYALDQLPVWIEGKDQGKIDMLLHNIRHMSVMRSDVMHKLSPANYKLVMNEFSPALLGINLEQCNFTLAPDLSKFPSLYLVNLMDCKNLVNISNLRKNGNIKFIYFDGCEKLKNLRPIEKTPYLELISVSRCPAMDDDSLSFLEGHSNITELVIVYDKGNPKLSPVVGRLMSLQQKIQWELNQHRAF